MSGKSTCIKITVEVLNKLYDEEFGEKSRNFLEKKAKKLGIDVKMGKDGQIVPVRNDPDVELALKISAEENQMILDTCIYKGCDNYALNPKSTSI